MSSNGNDNGGYFGITTVTSSGYVGVPPGTLTATFAPNVEESLRKFYVFATETVSVAMSAAAQVDALVAACNRISSTASTTNAQIEDCKEALDDFGATLDLAMRGLVALQKKYANAKAESVLG